MEVLPVGGVLFDFDGTLAAVPIDFAEMRRRAAELISQHDVPLAGIEHLYTLEMIEAALARLRESKRDPRPLETAAREALEQIELAAAARGALFSWVDEMVRRLERLGVSAGVVSRNCHAAVSLVMKQQESLFQVVLTRDEVEQAKPHPGHLAQAAERLRRADSTTLLMVGDHAMDMQAAREAGLIGIGVLTGSSTAAALGEAGAQFILPDASEVPAVVQAWNLRVAHRASSPSRTGES